MPLDPKYNYIRTLNPELCEEALRASGAWRKANTIPGTVILKRHLGHPLGTWTLGDCHQAMCDLQELAIETVRIPEWRGPRAARGYLRRKLADARRSHRKFNGGTGDCPCILCRIRMMWIEDMEEALSEW